MPLDHGFATSAGDVAVIAAADLLGSRAEVWQPAAGIDRPAPAGPMFRIGEPVIHRDHGIGLLEGIEEIALPEGTPHDALRLCYEGDATLMVPAHRDRGTVELWRRRLRRDARPAEGRALGERRAKLDRAIRTTAEKLVDAVHDRHARKAPKLVPETARFERLAARFGHVLTPDQAAAIDAVLADLSSGRRVDRLVCERTKAPRLESRSG